MNNNIGVNIMPESRLAVLESKVDSIEHIDDTFAGKIDKMRTEAATMNTKLQLNSMRLDTFEKGRLDLEKRIKKLEDKEVDVKKWRKNALALATIIASTIASLFFKK